VIAFLSAQAAVELCISLETFEVLQRAVLAVQEVVELLAVSGSDLTVGLALGCMEQAQLLSIQPG
jgi:hypothetical protein